MDEELPSEEFRTPERARLADIRSGWFGVSNIDQQYARVCGYELNDLVPEEVRIQYDLARNLYLYSFHVFRFSMVAQHHLYTTLEFAIRERYGKETLKEYAKKNKKQPGLRAYMSYLNEIGAIKNQHFPIWNHRREVNAKQRRMADAIQEMRERGLDSMEISDHVDVEEYDFEYDYVDVICQTIPSLRNEHAHGSKMLSPGGEHTFENVAIIINKIYK